MVSRVEFLSTDGTGLVEYPYGMVFPIADAFRDFLACTTAEHLPLDVCVEFLSADRTGLVLYFVFWTRFRMVFVPALP